MRVIVLFSDHERYISRPRERDISLIVKEEKEKLKLESNVFVTDLMQIISLNLKLSHLSTTAFFRLIVAHYNTKNRLSN
jgi:hypothetical protein